MVNDLSQAFSPKSAFLQELQARGLLHQCTNLMALDQAMIKGSVTIYAGYDATGKSLHVGNLISVMVLRMAQRHGHKPIVLMGGGTTKVGDPSGKDNERPYLADDNIQSNTGSIQKVFANYLECEKAPNKAIFVNNDDWLSQLNYMDFLRDYGRYFSVNRMLSFESVKSRLDRHQPLSFIEFNYMVLQSYDFLELNKKHKCNVQLGGSDQWGNIVSGVELVRRAVKEEVYGLTTPLLTTSNGKKMGKTENGAVWLNGTELSPFDYWQFWRNTEDASVLKFLKIYTDLPTDQIQSFDTIKGQEINDLKILLADEATRLAHGDEAVIAIRNTLNGLNLGSGRANSDSLVLGCQKNDIAILEQDIDGFYKLQSPFPIIQIEESVLDQGISFFQLLAQTALVKSNTEARRHIRAGACTLNGEKITTEDYGVTWNDVQDPGIIRLFVGKKHQAIVQIKTKKFHVD